MQDNDIEQLSPVEVWRHFSQISRIPRPSKKEEKILQFLKDFAQKHSLKFKQDDAGNLVMRVPPTAGLSSRPTLVLQSHVDMVCEKNKETVHDFEKDPIKLIRDGEWITADGTTLGSDNGIGVAMALATVTDPQCQHGRLELLFTVDEETGLTGANAIDPSLLTGQYLLNLDSEEDAFFIGCAGGAETFGTFSIRTIPTPQDLIPSLISIEGLCGGHSGCEIHLGRANAIKLLGRILTILQKKLPFFLANIEGGNLRNAIPRHAEAILYTRPETLSILRDEIEKFEKMLQNEFAVTEKELVARFQQSSQKHDLVFDPELTQKIILSINAIPHGLMSLSQEVPDLVETSNNLARIAYENDHVIIETFQRSSVESALLSVMDSLSSIFTLAGASTRQTEPHPGWRPNPQSPLLKKCKELYASLFGREAEVKAVHAGLECGVLGKRIPHLDMVSFGPRIEGPHSPDERVLIKSVEDTYKLLQKILVSME